MLYLVGIIITFFLILLLLGKKNKVNADIILAFWLSAMGFHLYIYQSESFFNRYKETIFFSFFFGIFLLYGPLLFLYTKYRIDSNSKFRKLDIVHFIPTILISLIVVPIFSIGGFEKNDIYNAGFISYDFMKNLVFGLIALSGVVYSISSIFLLKKYKQNIDSYFSNTEKINLNWLRLNIYGILFVWIVLFHRNDFYTFAGISLFVCSIGYFGIKQVGVFNDNFVVENYSSQVILNPSNTFPSNDNAETLNSIGEQKPVSKKYQKSALSLEDGIKIQETLRVIMETEKLYLNPELTLGDVAKKLSIHSNILSQVINTFEQKTFYDYINGLRIEAFKEAVAIEGNQRFTLFSLAFECGFNSKSSFNKHFKKVTNLTPSEYLNSLKES